MRNIAPGVPTPTPRPGSEAPSLDPPVPTDEDPARPQAGPSRAERLALGGVLALAAVLYLWRLDRNGWANGYYAAAVRSMSQSWHNFFFGAFDPGGFITVDKPPLALWVQTASVKVFGFNSWSLLVPQAIAGVAAVYVLYRIVRRQAGPVAGLVAAVALTVTPITVAVHRDNGPDTMMVLLLLLAAWSVQAAISTGAFRKLALAGVFIGLAFTTKMLQAYLVVPGLALAFAVTAAVGWRRRLGYLLGAGVVMTVTSAAWMVTVDLIPKADRPYVGGSTNNTVRDLVFGYNGLGRVNGGDGNGVGGGAPAGGGGAGGAGGGVFGGSTGWGRLFNDGIGGQIGWLIPFAALALLVGLLVTARRPRTDPVRAGVLMWGGWSVGCWAVFSFSKGIFHPYYTVQLAPGLAALVGIGTVTMTGLARRRSPWAGLLALGAAGSAAVEVVLLGRTPDWNSWLRPTVVALAVVAVVSVAALMVPRLAGRGGGRSGGRLVLATGAASLVAVLAGPAAYAVTPLTNSPLGGDPHAGPSSSGLGGLGGFGGGRATLSPSQQAELREMSGGAPSTAGTPAGGVGGAPGAGAGPGFGAGFGFGSQISSSMLSFLERNQGSGKYLVAVSGAQSAEDTIIQTGKAVLPMGGFTIDPTPTLAQFRHLVATGQLRYVLSGGMGAFPGLGAAGSEASAGGLGGIGGSRGLGGLGGGAAGQAVTAERTAWIETNCTVVNPSAYGGTTASPAVSPAASPAVSPAASRGASSAAAALYDCAGAAT